MYTHLQVQIKMKANLTDVDKKSKSSCSIKKNKKKTDQIWIPEWSFWRCDMLLLPGFHCVNLFILFMWQKASISTLTFNAVQINFLLLQTNVSRSLTGVISPCVWVCRCKTTYKCDDSENGGVQEAALSWVEQAVEEESTPWLACHKLC